MVSRLGGSSSPGAISAPSQNAAHAAWKSAPAGSDLCGAGAGVGIGAGADAGSAAGGGRNGGGAAAAPACQSAGMSNIAACGSIGARIGLRNASSSGLDGPGKTGGGAGAGWAGAGARNSCGCAKKEGGAPAGSGSAAAAAGTGGAPKKSWPPIGAAPPPCQGALPLNHRSGCSMRGSAAAGGGRSSLTERAPTPPNGLATSITISFISSLSPTRIWTGTLLAMRLSSRFSATPCVLTSVTNRSRPWTLKRACLRDSQLLSSVITQSQPCLRPMVSSPPSSSRRST
jgi:hypothetical protein